MTDAVVESDNEREEGLRWLVGLFWQRIEWDHAHQGRWSSALDMPGDVVEDGDATT